MNRYATKVGVAGLVGVVALVVLSTAKAIQTKRKSIRIVKESEEPKCIEEVVSEQEEA